MALSQFFTNLWNKAKSAPSFVPTYIEFPASQTDKPEDTEEFDDRRHYFMMSVSELFLSYQRLWYQQFSPMVFTVCSFMYDGKTLEIPYVIGPSFLEEYKQRLPKGMLFLNTPVMGIYPWRGGNVSVSVILCRVAQTNNADKLLNVFEDVAGSLDLTTGVSQYVKVGKAVLKGFGSLMGLNETEPVLGMNNNFGLSANNTFKPGYHAIIHAENLDPGKFWVKNNHLHYGDTLDSSTEYREHDFVLFRIGQTTRRRDEEKLSYYKEYREIYDYLANQTEITDVQRANLRARMMHLSVAIRQSPDLTPAHAQKVLKDTVDEINGFVETLTQLGEKEKLLALSPEDQIMEDTLKMLKF